MTFNWIFFAFGIVAGWYLSSLVQALVRKLLRKYLPGVPEDRR